MKKSIYSVYWPNAPPHAVASRRGSRRPDGGRYAGKARLAGYADETLTEIKKGGEKHTRERRGQVAAALSLTLSVENQAIAAW